MIKILVALETFFIKAFYFMVVWNWFVDGILYDFRMEYKTSLMLLIIYNAITTKMTTDKQEWEYEPWVYLFLIPIAFSFGLLFAWLMKLILL